MTLLPGADAPLELIGLGWDAGRTAAWAEISPTLPTGDDAIVPGRIVSEERGAFRIALATGDVTASMSGRLRHRLDLEADVLHPSVGDWVAVSAVPGGGGVIHAVLPRRSAIVRRGPTDRSHPTQVLAS
ncbi:MAG TPA: hypothetical protein VF484_07110, partial [Candidatus Limnocylindrales bacterium]